MDPVSANHLKRGLAVPSTDLSPNHQARGRHYQSRLLELQIHFRGQLFVQLKPLAQAIGIGENTIRNGGNIVRINGREVRPAVVNGRLTYDLAEVAEALALSDGATASPVPRVQAPRGRPRKRGLSATAGCVA